MRKNIVQTGKRDKCENLIIANDWFSGKIPSNVKTGESVYIDSSYGFAAFNSKKSNALKLGNGSSVYDRASFITSETGTIEIGDFSILNGCTIIASDKIKIGSYAMIAWGVVICDNFLGSDLNPSERRKLIVKNASSGSREMPFSNLLPIEIQDNVWIGFDSLIKPGTIIGRGSIVGSKTVVSGNIPPYSVVVGNPGRIVKQLEPTDKNFYNNINW